MTGASGHLEEEWSSALFRAVRGRIEVDENRPRKLLPMPSQNFIPLEDGLSVTSATVGSDGRRAEGVFSHFFGIDSIFTASPFPLHAKAPATRKPRTQTICSPLSATGQVGRWSAGMC